MKAGSTIGLMGIGAAALVLLSVSCLFFVAESRFYLENATAEELEIVFSIQNEDASVAKTIAPGITAFIASGQLLEADTLLPSEFFTRISATLPSVPEHIVFLQDPVIDQAWTGISRGSKKFDYTLRIDDSELSR